MAIIFDLDGIRINNMNVMTPTQYVNRAITEFPTLYAGKGVTLEHATFRCMDQLFNVIGNGVRDDEELVEFLAPNPKNSYDTFDPRLLTETLWYGYSEVSEYGWGIGESINCVESDKPLHPEIKKWLDADPILKAVPYPNFDKDYSTIYQCPVFLTFDDSWLDAAFTFYTQCLEFFLSDDSNQYHYAFPPANEQEEAQRLKDFADYIEKYGYKTDEEITEAYGGEVEYRGDLHDFLCRRWENEKQESIRFIKKTLSLLGHQKLKNLEEK